jgi:uncharacterized membrane protein
MAEIRAAIQAFAAGAAAMYLFDPRLGRRRRAMARNALVGQWNDVTNELDKAGRDLAHRAQGAVAVAKGAAGRAKADGGQLVERVRSAIGRMVSHPHAIAVRAEEDRVVLEGPVLAAEVDNLLRRVRAVPGVREVVSRLEVHQDASNIPGLQGGTRRESRWRVMQQNWTPTLRLFAAALGGSLIYHGLRRDGAAKLAGGLAGAALLARAIANKEFRQLVGAGGGPRVVEFEKAIHVHAPVEEVFAFWASYQNFPRFMTHLKEVRDLGNGRSHWVAEGPARIPISWNAELTQSVPNKLLAWRSTPGSTVETEGVVRFDPEPDGSTRIGIRLFYNPPGGVLGHKVASLFGADPKHEMDDDMVRFKSLMETGKTRAHGRAVTRDEIGGTAGPETGSSAW